MSYEDLAKFQAGELSLGLEERGFSISYDEPGSTLAMGYNEDGYKITITQEGEGIEAIMSVGAEISEDDYSQLPSLEESREAAANPSWIDMKFNGDRYFLTADLADPEHVDEMLDAYDSLKDSDIV